MKITNLLKQPLQLSEIIEANEQDDTTTILVEDILRKKKQVYRYYKEQFCSEPVLAVTSVFNAAQYAKIISENEFIEWIEFYIQQSNLEDEEEEQHVREEISFNSRFLKDLL